MVLSYSTCSVPARSPSRTRPGSANGFLCVPFLLFFHSICFSLLKNLLRHCSSQGHRYDFTTRTRHNDLSDEKRRRGKWKGKGGVGAVVRSPKTRMEKNYSLGRHYFDFYFFLRFCVCSGRRRPALFTSLLCSGCLT